MAERDLSPADTLPLWDLPEGARARLINISENVTYRVEAPGWRSILRVHRPGYHGETEIRSELAWMASLAEAGIPVPEVIPGRDGSPVQGAGGRHLVMFHFIEGAAPAPSADLEAPFRALGTLAARLHRHARTWQPPAWFRRPTWDEPAILGPRAIWGDWRDAPGVTPPIRAILERAEAEVRRGLATLGRRPERFGLIHGDMRLANLLISRGETRLIDFDDCGAGWFLYDFAAAVSFIETDPRLPALKAAWLAGYREVAPLSDAETAALDTLVMLRRLALLAWIGSHSEATEPQALAPHFADGTATLAEAYLSAAR